MSPRAGVPRRLLVVAGWSATAIVATIGPAARRALIDAPGKGGEAGSGGIAGWVFALFYGSWFLWAIAGGAATRSYRCARPGEPVGERRAAAAGRARTT